MKEYLKRYIDGGIYSTLSYGAPAVSKGLLFCEYLSLYNKPGDKTLSVGCGNGYDVVLMLEKGFDAYGTEIHKVDVPVLSGRIINAVCPDLPFDDDSFDLLTCTEVIEHIPEGETEDFIKECQRVGKRVFLSIATVDDPPFHTHINLHDANWWVKKLENIGFNIINFQYRPVFDLILGGKILHRASYAEGVTAYGY